jgi:hypothetical protein
MAIVIFGAGSVAEILEAHRLKSTTSAKSIAICE